uniref:Roadblock/LAMTOR2 domain-containing protein n=1 Tax=Ditylum brightwellii TaxID=49249 RepID=A0A7S4T9E9_9STRA|mmetsp:Transcript_14144/g.20841  ORF Transcript_14144/g.20841 Transcript_14144/m.20841 type:complete len:121 (-) Transcript_14144:431-793(-)
MAQPLEQSVTPIAANPPATSNNTTTLPDLESIPSQIGTAVLHSTTGAPVRPNTGQLTDADAQILYRMLLEVGTALDSSGNKDMGGSEDEGLRRVTVGFHSVSYNMTVGAEGYIYIVKCRQ